MGAPGSEHAVLMESSVGLRRVDPKDAAARRDHAVEQLELLDPASADWEIELSPVTAIVVDALLHADAATLDELVEPLRHAHVDLSDAQGHGGAITGYVAALLSAVDVALERLPDPSQFDVAEDSQAERMLIALSAQSLTSKEVMERLKTGDSQVSRVGRTLLAAGLVRQRRVGRVATWELTPTGRELLQRTTAKRRGRR
jgi:DNA-binding transcriptional ArsR family regulator